MRPKRSAKDYKGIVETSWDSFVRKLFESQKKETLKMPVLPVQAKTKKVIKRRHY